MFKYKVIDFILSLPSFPTRTVGPLLPSAVRQDLEARLADDVFIISSNMLMFLDQKVEKTYRDPLNQRNLICQENIGKIGVYAWYKNVNNKMYVGSGNPLYVRLCDYYQKWNMESKSNLYIVKALKKYTMENFTLFILEYSAPLNVEPSLSHLSSLKKGGGKDR